MTPPFEITCFTKLGGPLTKRISLSKNGTLHSDGSCCLMLVGRARRVRLSGLTDFADLIAGLRRQQAIALGALADGLPDDVAIVTKEKLSQHTQTKRTTIARTADNIRYSPGSPALALIDVDTKGMPPSVKATIDTLGGFWPALVSVIPELTNTGRVERASTSSGISRSDTGELLAGSNGLHIYLPVRDGADINRFLHTLHERCWLAGLGWLMVGAGGQLLDRSIVDRMVYAPERLVFEGPPILSRPLVQNQELRRPKVTAGEVLDTIAACPPLRIVEKSKLADLRSKYTHRLTSERATARAAFIDRQSNSISKRTGISPEAARHIAERHSSGVLLPHVVLAFDATEFAGCTVGDVLADPDRFVGATLADPLEGPDYGACKAKIMRRPNGDLWIHSFAHGRTTYELKYDAATVGAIIACTPDDRVVATFLLLMTRLEATGPDIEVLRTLVCERGKIGRRALNQAMGAARRERDSQARQERQEQTTAERHDPRPQIRNPAPDAPWLPEMQVLNDVLGKSLAPEPPMRDSDGYMVQVRLRRAPAMHLLTAGTVNAAAGENEHIRLPVPDHPLLTRLDDIQLSEVIEQHIDYVHKTEEGQQSVHLAAPFVRHFLVRGDDALPVVTAVATLPMVLGDGTILSGSGLNRDHGIVFRVPAQLQALIPGISDCTSSAVAEAMQFLTDDWLHDVACDYQGKVVLIAAAATILQRLLLPERPAFFVSAGQRGGGKTTAVSMISVAVLGGRAAAAAWSNDEEERRKGLLAYLGEGVPLICWDNIPRGSTISCPSIERALTAETYTDRILGVSEFRSVPATAIHVFTGNNIAPRSDLASRSLCVRLSSDRPDPENRTFHHVDPLGWTEANRARILTALYTILLANPRLREVSPSAAETRFKIWWHVVGSAIEHAARQHMEHVAALTMDCVSTCRPQKISFRRMLQDGEAEEEQTSALVTVLGQLRANWPNGCKASEVSAYAGEAKVAAIEFRIALEQASGKAIRVLTATTINWLLKAIADAPAVLDDKVVALRYTADKSGNGGFFVVKETR
jgi:hypothetical protein